MAISKRPPNTIYLGGGAGPGGGGGYTLENTIMAGGAITPGMLVELYDDSGTPKYRAHNAAAGTFAAKAFALEQIEWNEGVDDAYAAGDVVKVGIMYPGSLVWALVPSGQNIVAGDRLESNGDGLLKEGTTAPVARAYETIGAVTVATRVRVEVL